MQTDEETYSVTPDSHLMHLWPAVVAIDGPGASGKSTVGYRLAQKLNFLFFDTGMLYRAVTWAALARKVALADEALIAALAEQLVIDVAAPSPEATDGRQCTVLVDGEDVTWQLRTPAVDHNVSLVSAFGGVRRALSAQQRRIGEKYGRGQGDRAGVVMVGRDIGTVVMPEAPVKFYLDASPAERAHRRFLEQNGRNSTVEYEAILQDLLRRDRIDSERTYSPLRPADDAIVIDTSNLTPDEVVARMLELIARRPVSVPALSF
jgi:cytidylate kinase